MFNVLITGSSGFIGSSLKSHFKGSYNLYLPTRDELYSPTLFENVDVFIHLAGKAHDTADDSNYEEYELANTVLTNDLFDRFLKSDATSFIFLSSILVLKSSSTEPLSETMACIPDSSYAKSKNASELYIQNKLLPVGKRYFILRTPLVYGIGNKGNLPLLIDFIKKIPFWPLGSYTAKRSFCDIRNLSFVIQKLIENKETESGIYHIADNDVYDLNELYSSIARIWGKTPRVISVPKLIIRFIYSIGTFLNLPINYKQIRKLTATLLVSNDKIKNAIKSDLPFGGLDDLISCQKNNLKN